MEPAMKRRRLGQAPAGSDDEEDELDLEPDELNERRDPAAQLARGRAKAVDTLRSRFELIFAKYEKDFTGIGDEIDLSTGKLVVDNGHLSSLKDMKDWIVNDDDEGSFDEDDQHDEVNQETDIGIEERERPLPALKPTRRRTHLVQDAAPRDTWRIPGSSRASGPGQEKETEVASSSAHQVPLTNLDGTDQGVAREASVSIDQAWQAPELPSSAFLPKILGSDGGSKGRHYGSGAPVATRTALRSSLPVPDNSEADEADDLSSLLVSAPATKDTASRDGGHLIKSSPLIKERFPTVYSSPRDNGLATLIQDVLENMPDTPPSTRTSSITNSQGKALSLGQKSRLQVGANPKLIISESAPNDSLSELPKKRGRPPKSRLDPVTELEDLSGTSDQILWDSSDLESYLDVTSLQQINTLGKALYIDIRARNCAGKEVATVFEHSGTIKNNHGQGVATSRNIQKACCGKYTNGTGVNAGRLGTREENVIVATEIERPNQSKGFVESQKIFSPNVADPDFYFSDEEALLPKRTSKNKRQLDCAQLTLAPPESDVPKQTNVGGHTQTAAEHRHNVLQRERIAHATSLAAEAAQRVAPQNHVLVDFPALSSPTHVTSTPGSSLERGSSLDFSPTPDWLQQCASYGRRSYSKTSKPFPDLADASVEDSSRKPRRQPTPVTLESFKTGAVACPGNDFLLPSQKKHSVSRLDRADSTGITAFPNHNPWISLTNEPSAYKSQHGLIREKGALDTKPRDVQARKQALQTHTAAVDILTEQYTLKDAEPGTADKYAEGKTQIRRSVRLNSRPDAAEETTIPRGTCVVRRAGTKKVSMEDAQFIAPAISRITTQHSADEEERDSSHRQIDARVQLSAEQSWPHFEDDMDLDIEETSPVEQRAEHESAQAQCETLWQPEPKTIQQETGLRHTQVAHRHSTRSQRLQTVTAAVVGPDDREQPVKAVCQRCSEQRKRCDGRSPCSQCHIEGITTTGCIRESSDLASQENKTTAQELLRGAKEVGDDTRRLSPSVTQQRIEMNLLAGIPSPAARAPYPPKARPVSQPSTPRRPRARREENTMPASSVNTSMISLLSDSEDSADEISFNHSDFTPSGNHRIIVNRRFPEPAIATPRFSVSSSTTKKHQKSGVLYGRSHSASSHKVLKNLQTPRLAGEGGAASHRLPRSVVRVARNRDRDDEREASVVQTPRGTKRRCGAGGWKCDRDFCFVCM